nr:putative reverse transcriptase domain-containing protein [Tanacetum cinerariifolium]
AESSTETIVGAQEDASKQEGRIEAIDADENVTLVDIETQVDDELQERKDDVSAVATKEVNAAEPTVFDDEEVTMTMAQTLIKMKAEKARLLDEQMAKRMHDEEVEQAVAKEKQENDDLEKAKVLQKQYVNKQENIDWNVVVEQMQENHLDNLRKYQNLKRKLISIAQAKKNMIVYLKNMAGYKIEHFKGMTYDKSDVLRGGCYRVVSEPGYKELELTYPYEEVDPLNPLPPVSESEPDNEIEVENPIEHEDETVPASVYEIGESSVTPFLREDSDSLLPVKNKGKAKNKFYGKLILELGNEVHSSVEQGTDAMEKLFEKLGNTKDKVVSKKLKKELEEARFSNTFLRMQNKRVKRDLYWTRVRAHEFYQEMIRRGFVFNERPNKAINVSIEDEKSPSSESRGSPPDLIMPPKSAPMTQAAICRMIKDSVDATIAAKRARQANVRNNASGSGPARGQDSAPAICECTFAGFMNCNPVVFRGVEGAVKLRRWFEKTKSVFKISECAEGKKVKFTAATLEGPALTWWKTKVATMGLETVNQMP